MKNKYLIITLVFQIQGKSTLHQHYYLRSYTSHLISFTSHLYNNPLIDIIWLQIFIYSNFMYSNANKKKNHKPFVWQVYFAWSKCLVSRTMPSALIVYWNYSYIFTLEQFNVHYQPSKLGPSAKDRESIGWGWVDLHKGGPQQVKSAEKCCLSLYKQEDWIISSSENVNIVDPHQLSKWTCVLRPTHLVIVFVSHAMILLSLGMCFHKYLPLTYTFDDYKSLKISPRSDVPHRISIPYHCRFTYKYHCSLDICNNAYRHPCHSSCICTNS